MKRSGFLLVAAALALAGCSHRGPTLPDAFPAKGKIVSPGGQPLSAGRITFEPKDVHAGVEAWGEIQPDGSFTLTTYKLNDGAVPGEYVVTVSPYSYKTGNLKKVSPGQVPQRYLEASTSDLRVEVKPEDNVFNLRLSAQ